MVFSSVIALCLVGLVYGAPGKLPESFPRCSRSDPQLNTCLKNAVQVALPQLADGISSLGLFPLDPLRITALDIAQGSGPVSIDLKFRDLDIKGLKQVKVTDVKTDLSNRIIEISGYFDNPLQLDGKYEVKGSVLVLPLVGKGDSHLTLDNVKATIKLFCKSVKKDGKDYLEVDKLDVQYETSKLHMNFENLFSQEKALADNLNTFLNENWQDIHKEVKPAILEAFGTAFKAITTRILSKVPYDEVFLPRPGTLVPKNYEVQGKLPKFGFHSTIWFSEPLMKDTQEACDRLDHAAIFREWVSPGMMEFEHIDKGHVCLLTISTPGCDEEDKKKFIDERPFTQATASLEDWRRDLPRTRWNILWSDYLGTDAVVWAGSILGENFI